MPWAGATGSGKARAIGYSVLLHLVLLGLLSVSIQFPVQLTAPGEGPRPEVVRAVAIDESRVAEELTKIKEREAEKERAAVEQEQRVRKLQAQAAEAEQARKQEEQRLKEVAEKRKQAETEARQLAEKRAVEEAKTAATEKKRKEEEQRKAAADKKRKAEEARQKAAEEQQRKKAEEARRRKEEESLRAAMEEEKRQQRAASALSEYAPIIQQRVSRYWVRPPGADDGLKCRLLVRLTPGGEVTDVKIVRSSGNAAFDRSVQNAVFKATPLPLPDDPELARYFRDIEFIFDPSKG